MYEMSLALSQSRGSRADRVVLLGSVVSLHAVALAAVVVASAWQLVPVGEPRWMEPVRLPQIIPIEFPKQEEKRPVVTERRDKPATSQPPSSPTPPPAGGANQLSQPDTAELPIPTDPGPESYTFGDAQPGDPGLDVAGSGGGGEVADPTTPIQFGAGMVAPEVLRRVDPVYPTAALVVHREGTVVVEAEIDTEGVVRSVRVVSPRLGLGFEQAAETAVRAWRFSPARIGSRPVAVYFRLTVRFQLR